MNVRYDFGRNWSELAARLDHQHLDQASRDLERLAGEIRGRSFLDIGCGSGLHAAAAVSLGASRVHAVDFDPDCVATAKSVLKRFVPNGEWHVERADVLDPATLPNEKFDIVYSWGVLHHTGNMWRAIANAAGFVAPGGRLCLALYLKTPLCDVWKVEKRLYSSQKWLRPFLKWPYVAALLLWRGIRQRDAISFVRDYKRSRGMEFLVDVDDWLGGYPYESVVASELETFVYGLGFRGTRAFALRSGTGFFGTGCGEWCFEKIE